ncbi:MAG: SGNH/GDSL hydrolase family protein [Victivallaceae bacterium]
MKAMLLGGFVTAGVLIGAGAAEKIDPESIAIRPQAEYFIRGGLPNFYAKLRGGQPVAIAYLGGSITEQNGWRVRSLDDLRKRFPKSPITEIQAAIGGTGSELGAFRLGPDVLRHRPDLVFVEFAVNDNGRRAADILRSMEGIVRHIWTELPETDICFVYTVTAQDLKLIGENKTKLSTSTMEAVADYYQIPSVYLGSEVIRLLKDDKLVMKGPESEMIAVSGSSLDAVAAIPRTADGKIIFSGDGVHPYLDTGHVLYAEALKKALEKIEPAGTPGSHLPLPPANDPACFADTRAIPLDSPFVRLSGSVSEVNLDTPQGRPFRNRADKLWKLAPGAELRFRFKGSKVSLYNLLGPGCGAADITLDGKRVLHEYKFFDSYCGYHRIANARIGNDLDPDREHELVIKVTGTPFDKRGILMESRRGAFDQAPADFAPLDVYLASIFIIGEPVN